MFGIPASGTQAHSWVQAFPTELESFQAFAETYPDNSILLVDTYDTAEGARLAAQVGQQLEQDGHTFVGVRIDSGDLTEEIPRVRTILDEEGLTGTKIVVSNDLNEEKITALAQAGTMPDLFGVGTEMEVSRDDPALSVVYKLMEVDGEPTIKLSPGKITFPGRKQVFRTEKGDILALAKENLSGTPLLQPILVDGELVHALPSLPEIRSYCMDAVANLPDPFSMQPSKKLAQMVADLRAKYSPAPPDSLS
jgi:nicotinate phosphoribosyltransferase